MRHHPPNFCLPPSLAWVLLFLLATHLPNTHISSILTMDNNSNEQSTQGTTVKLNVGGRHYEVSHALIKQYPDTMLARLVSKEWNEDPNKRIFIDRDGGIFAHVLNYMRYGSIELPSSLPLAMFERELDYYGVSIEESCIHEQQSSIQAMKQIKQQIVEAELHHDMLLIAATCYNKFMSGKTTVYIRSGDLDLKHNPYFYDKSAMIVLNDYLGKFYGLQASSSKRLFVSDLDFVLKVTEVTSSNEDGNSQGKNDTHSTSVFCFILPTKAFHT